MLEFIFDMIVKKLDAKLFILFMMLDCVDKTLVDACFWQGLYFSQVAEPPISCLFTNWKIPY